jgi:hypothetical protein
MTRHYRLCASYRLVGPLHRILMTSYSVQERVWKGRIPLSSRSRLPRTMRVESLEDGLELNQGLSWDCATRVGYYSLLVVRDCGFAGREPVMKYLRAEPTVVLICKSAL